MYNKRKSQRTVTFSGYFLCLQPYCYGEPSREIMRVCVRLTWQGQKDLNPRHAVLEQIEVRQTTCRTLPSVEP